MPLESKECLCLNLGRAYIDYLDIDHLCLSTFPDEPLNAVQAFKNVVNSDIYDPGEKNTGFSNHVGWLEPVQDTLIPSNEAIENLERIAAEFREKTDSIIFVCSSSFASAIKAGVDFFYPDFPEDMHRLIFAESGLGKAEMQRLLSFAKQNKCGLIAAEDIRFSHGESLIFNELKSAVPEELVCILTNSSTGFLSEFARQSNVKTVQMDEGFTANAAMLSHAALLPLAIGGINIGNIVQGACLEPIPDMESFVPAGCAGAGATLEIMLPLSSLNIKNYSAAKHLLQARGFVSETFVYASPRLAGFVQWAKNMFTQTSSIYADALHVSSVNDAQPLSHEPYFETVLQIGRSPEEDEPTDLDAAANASLLLLMRRQRKSGLPIIHIELPRATPEFYGAAISLFAKTAEVMKLWK